MRPQKVISKRLSAGDGEVVIRTLGSVSVATAMTVDTSSMTEDKIKARLEERERARFHVPERSRIGKESLIRHSVVENMGRPDMEMFREVDPVSDSKRTSTFVAREHSPIRIPHYTDQRNNYKMDVRTDVSVSKVTHQVNHRYEL